MSSARALLRRSKKQLKAALTPLAQNWGRKDPAFSPEHWGLSRDARGQLCMGEVNLPDLCQRFGSPLYVVNEARLLSNLEAFCQVPTGASKAPEVYYSYKTNPVPSVLQRIHAHGVGAEVISEYELWLARKMGMGFDRIVYNGPVKSDASVRESIRGDILLLNVNHREELAQVSRIAREEKKKVRVGIRAVPSMGWAGQFGISIESGEALEAYREALRSEWLDVVSLHVHRGGQIRTEGEASAYLSEVLAFAAKVEEVLGRPLEILDVGGSLCSPSVTALSARSVRLNRTFQRPLDPPPREGALSIREYVRLVMTRVEASYRERGLPAPRVFLEPGRSMTSDTALLLASVHTLKEGAGQPVWAILNAGQNLAESLKGEFHHVLSASKSDSGPLRSYALAGPICSPGDVLTFACELPALEPGDVLAVMDAGAYFVPFSTSFSFPRPATVMVDRNGKVEVVRRAESFEDIIRLDVFDAAATTESAAPKRAASSA